MNRYCLLLLVPCLVLLVGCAENAAESNPAFAARMREKAVIIGQKEIVRFNAADLVYKNVPELHTTIIPIMNTKRHLWAKTYRSFTDFEVIDITRSSSLLSPLSYSILFNYDQYSTPARLTDVVEDALEVSKRDMIFQFRFSDSFTRYYMCDEEGNLIDSLPPIPLRADYFDEAYNGEADLGVPPR